MSLLKLFNQTTEGESDHCLLWCNAVSLGRHSETYVGTVGSIQSLPNYPGGQLRKNTWKMKIELCTIICVNVSLQFRVQRQVVELESRYITQSILVTWSKVMGQLPIQESKTCGERRVCEWAKDTSANELRFCPCTEWQKNYITLLFGQHREVQHTHTA